MPSSIPKSTQNAISALSLCEGTALFTAKEYQNRPRNKTVMAVCERVFNACQTALSEYPADLDARTILEIRRRSTAIERAAFDSASIGDVVMYTSFSLGILDGILGVLKDQYRKIAIESVHAAMLRLHRYFDRRGMDWESYAKADKAVALWLHEAGLSRVEYCPNGARRFCPAMDRAA